MVGLVLRRDLELLSQHQVPLLTTRCALAGLDTTSFPRTVKVNLLASHRGLTYI